MSRHLKQILLLRTALLKTLSAENEKLYCKVLHLWLRKKCTRWEFDLCVKKILTETGFKLHTKFLASLSKISCRLISLPLVERNKHLRKLFDYNGTFFNIVDKTLPCEAVCSARFFVIAWDSGIITVNSDLGKLLCIALTHYLKDIIFKMFAVKKSHYIRFNQLKFLQNKGRQKMINTQLPKGFIYRNTFSTMDLILTLKLNPALMKFGFSKYLDKAVNGPLCNNVAELMPLIC